MKREVQPLPMAPSGCELDDRQRADQLARYRQLSANVTALDRDGDQARIVFDEQVHPELIEQTVAIERDCCSFFTLDYDPSARVLAIRTDRKHADGLTTLLTALTPEVRVGD